MYSTAVITIYSHKPFPYNRRRGQRVPLTLGARCEQTASQLPPQRKAIRLVCVCVMADGGERGGEVSCFRSVRGSEGPTDQPNNNDDQGWVGMMWDRYTEPLDYCFFFCALLHIIHIIISYIPDLYIYVPELLSVCGWRTGRLTGT